MVSRADGIISEPVLGDTVILDLAADRYSRLNASAGVVWEALAEPGRVSDLAGALSARFGLSPERALADATTLVRNLADRRLVVLDG